MESLTRKQSQRRCRAGGSLAAATEGLKPRALIADSGRPEFLVLRKIWSLWREVSISLGFHLDSTAFNMSSYILVWSNLLGPNAAISSKISLLWFLFNNPWVFADWNSKGSSWLYSGKAIGLNANIQMKSWTFCLLCNCFQASGSSCLNW